jgi:hypothetical protein
MDPEDGERGTGDRGQCLDTRNSTVAECVAMWLYPLSMHSGGFTHCFRVVVRSKMWE